MADAHEIEIVRGREELLDAPRPLWLALRDHHHAVAPDMGPVRSDDETWTRRRAQYAAWIAEDERAHFLLARRDGHVVAYAFLRPIASSSVTWAIEHDGLDLETLSVAPEARGTGIGGQDHGARARGGGARRLRRALRHGGRRERRRAALLRARGLHARVHPPSGHDT
jgi:GNAT superfamily N-acetyltransferase